MPSAAISFGAYERTGNPKLVARNCYAEQVPGPSGPQIQMRARGGLEDFITVGTATFRGVCAKDGIFGGAALIVNGTTAYLLDSAGVLTTLTGTVAGDGLVDIDSYQDADFTDTGWIATGSALYKVQSGVVTLEDFPIAGGAGAVSVCCHRGFVAAVSADDFLTYVLIPGDTVWQALSFVSADYGPDKMVAIRSRGDQMGLLGSSTFEAWTLNTEAADPPLVPYGGLNFDFGCRSRDSAVNCAGSLIWVDNLCRVQRWDGGQASVISTPGMAAIIRSVSASDLRAWTYTEDTHQLYVLTIGNVATWVYDLDGPAGRWTTFDSLTYDYWRAHLGCTLGAGDAVIALDNLSSQVWRRDPDLRTDSGDVFGVEVCATIEGGDQNAPLGNVALLCDLGDVPLSGQGSDPLVGLQISRDQGKTFSDWMQESLAQTGEYGVVPIWNGLGTIPRFLGVILRFRISDPVGRVFKRVFVNV